MRFKVASGIVLTLLFIGMLALAFNPPAGAHPMIVSVLIDYGNGSISWHDRVSLPGGATVFNATMAVAYVNYTVNDDLGVSVEAINDVWNSWEWWYWNFTRSAWVHGPVACDKYVLTHGEIIAWYYGNVSQEPTAPPPRTIIVPDDFRTIQWAIEAAKPGDTVYVRAGTYPEHVTINKVISLIGENRSTTVIDGNGTGYIIHIIASYVNVTGFTIRNGTNGISIETSDYNVISGNILTDNQCGIYLFATCECDLASENTIKNNVIKNNNIGIHLKISKNNLIYHNNFINNTQQVYIDAPSYANSWDDSYRSGGNYWSDYAGEDANGNGIGDSPYIIDENNRDRYPLMNPWTPSEPFTPTPPEVRVGVKAGDWIKYDYTVTGAPSGTPLPTLMKTEFLSVEGTTATVRVTTHMSNGTEQSDTMTVDIVAGEGTLGTFSGFVIPANCTTGDFIYISVYGDITIAGETTRTYAGASRTVVYTSFSQYGIQLTYYWDKQTGVMVEASATSGSVTTTAKATETNMWEAPPPPFWMRWWFWATVTVVIVVLAGAVYFLKRRKPPTPAPTAPTPSEGTLQNIHPAYSRQTAIFLSFL